MLRCGRPKDRRWFGRWGGLRRCRRLRAVDAAEEDGLASDGREVFWAKFGFLCHGTGTAARRLVWGAGKADQLVVDTREAYWVSDDGLSLMHARSTGGGPIMAMKAPEDRATSIMTSLTPLAALALGPKDLGFVQDRDVQAMSRRELTARSLITLGPGEGVAALSVDAKYMYIARANADGETSTLLAIPLAGGAPTLLIPRFWAASSLAQDGGHLYVLADDARRDPASRARHEQRRIVLKVAKP